MPGFFLITENYNEIRRSKVGNIMLFLIFDNKIRMQ